MFEEYIKDKEILNVYGDSIIINGVDVRHVNITEDTFAISKEGVIIPLENIDDLIDIVKVYYNTNDINIEKVSNLIKLLNKGGFLVYKGRDFNDIEGMPNYLVSFSKDGNTNEQKLMMSLLLANNLEYKNNKYTKGVKLNYGYVETGEYIYGKGYSNSIEDSKLYNSLLEVNEKKGINVDGDILEYSKKKFDKSIQLESSRIVNITNELAESLEQDNEYEKSLELKEKINKINKINTKIFRYDSWSKYMEFYLNREITYEKFLAYKYRKQYKFLYDDSLKIPTDLIKDYYKYCLVDNQFDNVKKAFVTRYCTNETKLEDTPDEHSKEEKSGLRAAYEYIHSGKLGDSMYSDKLTYDDYKRVMFHNIDYKLLYQSSSFANIIYVATGLELTLLKINEQLFSKTPHPESGGYFSKEQRRIDGSTKTLPDYREYVYMIRDLDRDFQTLLKDAKEIKENKDSDRIIDYLNRCVKLQHALIIIHPFIDGNGRTMRVLTNILFEEAGLPPVYVKANEKRAYIKALKKADNGDFSELVGFYRYKVCDSIVELDINERISVEKKNIKVKK